MSAWSILLAELVLNYRIADRIVDGRLSRTAYNPDWRREINRDIPPVHLDLREDINDAERD